MHTLQDFVKHPNSVLVFETCGGTFTRDSEFCAALNTLLGCNLRYAYRDAKAGKKTAVTNGDVTLDTGEIYLVTEHGKVLVICNSEWASISAELG